jgi:hypothetical protein
MAIEQPTSDRESEVEGGDHVIQRRIEAFVYQKKYVLECYLMNLQSYNSGFMLCASRPERLSNPTYGPQFGTHLICILRYFASQPR